jgi:hypothetical protein
LAEYDREFTAMMSGVYKGLVFLRGALAL